MLLPPKDHAIVAENRDDFPTRLLVSACRSEQLLYRFVGVAGEIVPCSYDKKETQLFQRWRRRQTKGKVGSSGLPAGWNQAPSPLPSSERTHATSPSKLTNHFRSQSNVPPLHRSQVGSAPALECHPSGSEFQQRPSQWVRWKSQHPTSIDYAERP
jgi:hypothetical protein